MSRNRKKVFPELKNIEIIDLAAEGKAVARADNMVVFVTGAIPGDVADLRVIKKKKNFMEAVPVHFHRYSELRTKPACSHFGTCGGCTWQQMEYSHQLHYKEKQVKDQFERIGRINTGLIQPILPSGEIFHYRNKLEFTFSNRRWYTQAPGENETVSRNALGFHIPGRFDRVLDIETCHLQPEPSNAIRTAIREYALAQELDFHDPYTHEGFLRNLLIRNTVDGQVMVVVTFTRDDKEKRERLLNEIQRKFPAVQSLMYAINPKMNDAIADLEVIRYKGEPWLTETMEDLKFRIGPKSFFQTNTRQGLKLYQVARDFAGLTGNEVLYDLYTGTGTIAIFLARSAKKVIGIEYIEEAIHDANINARLNGLDNCEFIAGDMKDVFTDEFIFARGKPDVIVLDPPRAGVHEKVIDGILYAQPRKIVYVSCNPATQARDIARLAEFYDVTRIQPVDMFPHTQHVENVALLERRKPAN